MSSNPLRIRNSSGRDIDILCGGAGDEPRSPRTLPIPHDTRSSFSELSDRQRVALPPLNLRPRDSTALTLRQRTPIQLPPLEQRSENHELRRCRTHWDLSVNSRDEEYAYDPFSAPDLRCPQSASSSRSYFPPPESRRHSCHDGIMMRARTSRKRPASPETPGLFRCGSRDSLNTNEPVSPATPRDTFPDYGYQLPRNSSFSSATGNGPSIYPDPTQFEHGARAPPYEGFPKGLPLPFPSFPATMPDQHVAQYHEVPQYNDASQYHDAGLAAFAASQGGFPPLSSIPPPPTTVVNSAEGKRYHCRYARMVGCMKTFTTSGHASRHSKIHTCEKGIQCSYEGCLKKFTRADNMKQHYETHFKDTRRARSAAASGSSAMGRHRARRNMSANSIALRREERALEREMTRLQMRQKHAVHQWSPVEMEENAAHGAPGAFAHAMERGESSSSASMAPPTSQGDDSRGLDALAAAVAERVAEDSDGEISTPGPSRRGERGQ